ncbi:hypothetical protein ATANTOWER_008010 [Ataeniobius toweri]|uniref:Uncharacterized protein n=1 Tax=Ataeniobius toweri TaxID=208326 RepID=A0ABU7BHR0_9TELE|nr:hypothetical protein [Ataeniobius toweri]
MDNLCCASCLAPLQPEDGHDMCPPCLGVDHLREELSDHACSNCSVLPRAVRLARVSSVEQPSDWAVSVQQDPLPLGQAPASTKRSAEDVPLASGRRAKWRGPPRLSTRVDQLSTELAQMKALLQSLQAHGGRGETSPPEQGGSSNCEADAISGAASGTLFQEAFPELGSRTSGSGSGASQGGAGEPVSAAIRTALGRLQLDVPPAQSAPSSAFFRRRDAEARSCMLAGWTRGPFPARWWMARPCTRRPSLGWAACPCRICHCLSYCSS